MTTTSKGLLNLVATGFFAIAAVAGMSAQAKAQQPAIVPVSSSPVGASGDAKPVIAWVDFCRRNPAECRVNTAEPQQIELTQKTWKTITSTNVRINREIDPVTDMDHWGQVDRWDLAEDGRGDCEEYVLVKRKKLVEAGIPRRALLVTVVIDDENQGHAVLMVRTDRGDFILDNKRNAVLPWHQTGYVYVKRESQDKVAWTSLGGQGSPTATAAQ